jgi:hypothetical protein
MFATSLLALGACRSSNTSRSTDDGANGIAYGRTYDEQRFSPLHQINEQNVSKLGLVWSREFGTARGLEAKPLVANGVLLPVYNNHRRGNQLHISCGRRSGYRNVWRFMNKENSYYVALRGGHSSTLPSVIFGARREGFSVLSNRSCSSSAFCCRTYAWFSPVRSHMGS